MLKEGYSSEENVKECEVSQQLAVTRWISPETGQIQTVLNLMIAGIYHSLLDCGSIVFRNLAGKDEASVLDLNLGACPAMYINVVFRFRAREISFKEDKTISISIAVMLNTGN